MSRTFCTTLTLRITDVLHLFYSYSPFHLAILGEDEDRVIEMLADEIQRKQKEAEEEFNSYDLEPETKVDLVDHRTAKGITPLRLACHTGNAHLVRVLLEAGARDPLLDMDNC